MLKRANRTNEIKAGIYFKRVEDAWDEALTVSCTFYLQLLPNVRLIYLMESTLKDDWPLL